MRLLLTELLGSILFVAMTFQWILMACSGKTPELTGESRKPDAPRKTGLNAGALRTDTFCRFVVQRYGKPECIGELALETVGRRRETWRLTRIAGEETKVACINGSGRKIICDPFQDHLFLPILPPSPMQARVSRKTVHDEHGCVQSVQLPVPVQKNSKVVGVRYKRNKDCLPLEMTFLDGDHNPVPNTRGVTRIQWELDARGNPVEQWFFDAKGEKKTDADGSYGKRRILDEHDREVEFWLLDKEGQPAKEGLKEPSGRFTIYDDRGNAKEITHVDAEKNPQVTPYGFAKTRMVHDDAGNEVEKWYYDEHDRPSNHSILNCHGVRVQYGKNGKYNSMLKYDKEKNIFPETGTPD